MFKVLKEVAENNCSGSRRESSAPCPMIMTYYDQLKNELFIYPSMFHWQKGWGFNNESFRMVYQLISVSIGNRYYNHCIHLEPLGSCVSQCYLSEASIGGRVKDGAAKAAIAGSLGDLGGAELMDLETGAFKAKKAKKEKTLEEQSMADLKSLEKRFMA